MYNIDWNMKAVKQLRKIKDDSIKNIIFHKVDQLKCFPNCEGIKQLINHKYDFRLRVGKYRILFNVMRKIKVISVKEVKNRDEQTY